MPTPTLSYEFFPPRSDAQSRRFWRTFGTLETLAPDWVSVTFGALGSAKDASLETVKQLQKDTAVPVAAHLTCGGQTRAMVESTLDLFESYGVRRIVALRGDAASKDEAHASAGGNSKAVLHHASELVEIVAERGIFDISVAAYPEIHPEAKSAEDDLRWLKAKFEAGASRALTQFFFDPDVFLRWRDRALASGIDGLLVPGILPIHDINKVEDFSEKCGAHVPDRLKARFAGVNDPRALHDIAIDQCLELCNVLQREGVDAFHIYTLNQSRLAYEIGAALGSGDPDTPRELPVVGTAITRSVDPTTTRTGQTKRCAPAAPSVDVQSAA